MKILFFIESLGAGGKERRLVELVKSLQSGGVKCEVTLLRDKVHYQGLSESGASLHVLRRTFRKDPRPFISFFNTCRRCKPDIIHVWGNLPAYYAIPTKILLRLPMVNSQITDAPRNPRHRLLENTVSFRYSDAIISNSWAGLRAYRISLQKGTVVHNGFDPARIRNLKDPEAVKLRLGIKTRFVVAMVASFSPAKDYKTYLVGAQDILSKRDDVTFLCVGDGDYSAYMTLVKQEHAGQIVFLGRQTDVESIMNMCDFGVLTTFTEGFSNALMEFMALGKPVVATDGGGTNELVEDGKSGFLIKPESVDELVGRMNLLLERFQLRESMGTRARRRISDNFGLSEMTESFVRVYRGAMKRKPEASSIWTAQREE